MTADDFCDWIEHMRVTRAWSKAECARQLGAGRNQIPIWCERGAPPYIAYACTALARDLPPWRAD